MKTKKNCFSRALVLMMAFMLVFTMMPSGMLGAAETAYAGEEETITAYVSISENGKFIKATDETLVAYAEVEVSDYNQNGSFDIDDVLYAAHEKFYDGGAENGYASADQGYGLRLVKLWGNESDNFGYQLNRGNVQVTSLGQTVNAGDAIDVYINQSTYPDNEDYVSFDKSYEIIGTGEDLKLTLKKQVFDDQWLPSMTPYTEGSVVVTQNGQATDTVVDASGNFNISFETAGTYVVSAQKTKIVNESTVTAITAPVCIVKVISPINVRVSAQKETEYTYMPKTVSVAYGTAKKYGFDNGNVNEGTITALDALVAAHAEKYGDSFTPSTAGQYLSVSYGNPTDEATGMYSGFAVNHKYCKDADNNGYMVNTAPLTDGDVVDFFYYEDGLWCDMVSYFETSNHNIADRILLETGEKVELYLKGFMFMTGYLNDTGSEMYNEDGALSVYLLGADGQLGDELAAVKATDGKISLAFDKAGEYCITAMGYDNLSHRAVMPYCKVTVEEAGSIEDNKASKIEITGVSYQFDKNKFSYELPNQANDKTSLSFKVTAPDAKSIKAIVNEDSVQSMQSGKSKVLSISAGTNTIKIIIEPSGDRVTTTYTYIVKREPALKTLVVTDESGNAIPLNKTFNSNTLAYEAKVLAGSKISITGTAQDAKNTGISVNGEAGKDSYDIKAGENKFTVLAKSKDNTLEKTYTLTVMGKGTAETKVTGPKDMILRVVDFNGVLQTNPTPTLNDDGTETFTFEKLAVGENYTWTAGKYGYNAKSGELAASTDETDNVTVSLVETTVPVSDIAAQWKNFRNSDSNMAVVNALTPTSAEETKLKWAQNGASTQYSPGTYIIVNNKIVYTNGNKISFIDKKTGAVEKTTTMAESRGYAYMPPVYGGGMIYVSLNKGKIQAFDAETLESCWVYTDAYGGQALSNLTYDNGYVYTGFWNKNTTDANFVCITAEDEDPKSETEEKAAVWDYTHTGGFYWSGAYVRGDYITVGGVNALYVFDKKTGEVVDKVTEFQDGVSVGQISSSIAEANGKLYFTSKAKKFCEATLNDEGKITITKLIDLSADSTSTPVVVGKYAYIGANKQIAQINLQTNDVKTITIPAESKSSLLANTSDNMYSYFYFAYNAKPGGVEVVKVNNQTGEMNYSTLFVPEADKQQYCIASIMCDNDGTLYYYNDSGYLFALEKTQTYESLYKLSFEIKDSDGRKIDNASVDIISMNGNAALDYVQTDGVFTLKNGIYTYEIKADGYKAVNGNVRITNANTVLPIVMQKEDSGSAGTVPVENIIKIEVVGYKGEIMYPAQTMNFKVGMTALSALQSIDGIKLDWSSTQYGAYVVAIDGLGEFDNGSGSGWMYKVNGKFPSYSAGDYVLKAGDEVVWMYTVDLGNDVGGGAPVEDIAAVTTDKTAGTTTSPTDVKLSEKTNADGSKESVATVTVSADNQKEILKQAKANKSKEIILNVTKDDVKAASKADVQLDKSFIEGVLKDTDAKLTVKTPFGDKTYTQDELKALAAATTGKTVSLEIVKSEKTDEELKAEQLEAAKAAAAKASMKARSTKTAKGNIKVVFKPDTEAQNFIQEMKDMGYTVKYRFYRSTKKSSGYKAMLTKTSKTYTNTSGKKGTKYYYKVQVRVYDENGKCVAKTALKQCKYACRTWTKK